MLSRLMKGLKVLLVGGLAAVALLLAARPAAAVSSRPAVFREVKAVQGLWKAVKIDDQGDLEPSGLQLKADGRFAMETTHANGDIEQKQGSYTYAWGYLALTEDNESEPFAVFGVEIGDDILDLHAGSTMIHWTRDGVVKLKEVKSAGS